MAQTSIAASNALKVCPDCKVSTLIDALSMAGRGDSIMLQAGRYKAIDIEIKRPIYIIGEPGVVLDGHNEGYILKILADSVFISNIQFVNPGKSYTRDYAAIYLSRSRDFVIEHCKIQDPFFGILVEKSHHGRIENNTIIGHSVREDDSGNGIHLWHCSNIEVMGNEIAGLRDGIYFEFVSRSAIADNYSHRNIRYGLHFMFSDNNSYRHNNFENNGAGVAVMFSKHIDMEYNQFHKNWGTASYGLLLKEIYDSEISNNNFEQNTTAIFVEGCSRINYSNNDLRGNGWAIKVAGACYANKFECNNFLHNAFDISYNGKLNDNQFSRNFWSTYSGYDLDRDGIGDVPFRPVKLFSYVVNQTPETIVLLRSFFVDIINFSERVSPIFTPDALVDTQPVMTPNQ